MSKKDKNKKPTKVEKSKGGKKLKLDDIPGADKTPATDEVKAALKSASKKVKERAKLELEASELELKSKGGKKSKVDDAMEILDETGDPEPLAEAIAEAEPEKPTKGKKDKKGKKNKAAEVVEEAPEPEAAAEVKPKGTRTRTPKWDPIVIDLQNQANTPNKKGKTTPVALLLDQEYSNQGYGDNIIAAVISRNPGVEIDVTAVDEKNPETGKYAITLTAAPTV